MLLIGFWLVVYSVIVALSIIFLGNPSTLVGALTVKSLLGLLPDLASAHLTITAVATTASVVFVILVNHFLLGEQLRLSQIIGIAIVLFGLYIVFAK